MNALTYLYLFRSEPDLFKYTSKLLYQHVFQESTNLRLARLG